MPLTFFNPGKTWLLGLHLQCGKGQSEVSKEAMVCGQVPRCRRLCRPRPFLLALLVALCLFCQTLTPLMTSSILSAVVNGIAPYKLTKTQQGKYKEVSPSTMHCFLPGSNSETVKKVSQLEQSAEQ